MSSGSIRLRRSNSPVCRRRESRLTRISLTIVWLFLFCHIWKLIPTAFEVFYARDQTFPTWMHYIKHTSHALIVLNSSLNFLIYVIIWVGICNYEIWDRIKVYQSCWFFFSNLQKQIVSEEVHVEIDCAPSDLQTPLPLPEWPTGFTL